MFYPKATFGGTGGSFIISVLFLVTSTLLLWPGVAQAESRYELSTTGFVNGYDAVGPVRIGLLPRRGERLESSIRVKGHDWKALTQRGPALDLWSSKRKMRGFLLRGSMHSRQKKSVTLRMGLTGVVDVYLNGRRVYTAEDSDYLLLDDHEVDVVLRAGGNDLVIRLESLKRLPLRFALRIRDGEQKTPKGLMWSMASKPSDCELVEANLSRDLDGDLWRSRVEMRYPALRPVSVQKPLWMKERMGTSRKKTWEVSSKMGPRRSGKPPPDRSPTRDWLEQPGRFVPHAMPTAYGGKGELNWGLGEQTCGTLLIRSWPKLTQRLSETQPKCNAIIKGANPSSGDRESLEQALINAHRHLVHDVHKPRVEGLIGQLERLCSEKKSDLYGNERGLVHRAYRSKLDGNLQPYVLFVPKKARKTKSGTSPLVVTFHGLGFTPEETLRITLGQRIKPGDLALDRAPPKGRLRDPGAYVLAVHGYGSVGHRTLGELDVLRAIEEVKANYPIDDDKVSITGFSLGGTVAFVLPLHYPSLFSAAAPLCGYPNLRQFFSVKYKRKKPWEKVLLTQRSIVEYAENGRRIPMKMKHGAKDKPERSELMLERFQELGYRSGLEVYEDLGHRIWHRAYQDGALLRWLSKVRRPDAPSVVSFRSAHHRFSRAHWLRVDRPLNGQSPWSVEARRRGKKLTLKTSNVKALSVERPESLKYVRVDKSRVEIPENARELRLERYDAGWGLASPTTKTLHKRAGLSGPLDDIWYGPFVVVVGTQDPQQTETNRLVAEELRRYNYRTDVAVPIVRDVDVTDTLLNESSLMLVGNPRSNLITARAQSKLPVRFEEKALRFGDERFEGDDVGVSLIYPSPFNTDRYLVLHAGVTRTGTLSARNLPALVPDYLVYDKGIRAQYGAKVLDKRRVLKGGFFDENWKSSPR